MPDELDKKEIDRRNASSGRGQTSPFWPTLLAAIAGYGIIAFIEGRYWLGTTSSCVAIALYTARHYWTQVKLRVGHRFAAYLDRVANDSRYRWGAVILLMLYPVISGSLYVVNLRHDLDMYVMPRAVTSEQAKVLQEYLSRFEPQRVEL
jgi:hypothetical protein